MDEIIPLKEVFTHQSAWLLVIITVVAIAVLSKGADWLVEGAAGLAFRLGMPKIIIGATIVSLGTTSPECAVSVMAAWQGNAGLALGNAVGSIIADTGLIFGLGCVMVALPADRFILNRQGWVQVGSGVLLAALCYVIWMIQGDAATLGRSVGALLLVLLGVYMAISVHWSRQHSAALGDTRGEAELPDVVREKLAQDEAHPKPAHVLVLVAMLAVGLAMVLLASHGMISAVTVLALRWGVPEVVIAGTVVALGTSMPELVVGMTSIYKGHSELLVGNVIGADILNVLFVTGAAALAKPLPIIEHASATPAVFLWLHLPVMLLMLVIFRFYIAAAVPSGRFSRWMGVPLLLLYVGYVAVGFMIPGL